MVDQTYAANLAGSLNILPLLLGIRAFVQQPQTLRENSAKAECWQLDMPGIASVNVNIVLNMNLT